MADRSGIRRKATLAATSRVGALGRFGAWARRLFGSRPAADRVGPYQLHEQIGEGGMGVVFRATHTELGSTVAIKLLAPGRDNRERRERFEHESELTSRLAHPNTVAVYARGRTPSGVPFYAMEYVDGVDLEALVQRNGPLDPHRVTNILAQLAGALAEAHALGFVHRDVKPSNVVLRDAGGDSEVAKLLDFGLAQELGAHASTAPDLGRVVGTPLYLPPEAILSPERIDPRSDLYALGALGYFLLVGEPPFSGATVAEVCAHHLHTAPPSPSRRVARVVPHALEALILRCLAKSPESRPESAARLLLELEELTANGDERAAA